MSRKRRIAVLGAGIMGSAMALNLARRGDLVELFDAAPRAMSAASRWNEGKIHLGYLYNRDHTMRTADKILTGGLEFKTHIEALIGTSIDQVTTQEDDVYLCHRRSVVDSASMNEYFRTLDERVCQHPSASRYLVDATQCRTVRLTSGELSAMTDSPEIVAGFRVRERSVSTTWIADQIEQAIQAQIGLEFRPGIRIMSTRPATPGEIQGTWIVEAGQEKFGPYDLVVNALWNGRLPIDRSAGLHYRGPVSNRYRLAVFLRSEDIVDLPSAIVATGPFGDIKNYNGRDFYLSWYPEGLMIDSSEHLPPPPPVLTESERNQRINAIFDALEALMPRLSNLRKDAGQAHLQGGWVFAVGQGVLADPDSTLHSRTDFGLVRYGAYFSIDTGKYSTAPWMAWNLVNQLA